MSEGELYKQIREQATFCEKRVLPCNKVQGVVSCITARTFLDEAKKEFPLESDFLLAVAEKGFERATFQFLLDLHLKRNTWFEKWFGGYEKLSQCKFAQRCLHYQPQSFTCNKVTDYQRDYCGKYREMNSQ